MCVACDRGDYRGNEVARCRRAAAILAHHQGACFHRSRAMTGHSLLPVSCRSATNEDPFKRDLATQSLGATPPTSAGNGPCPCPSPAGWAGSWTSMATTTSPKPRSAISSRRCPPLGRSGPRRRSRCYASRFIQIRIWEQLAGSPRSASIASTACGNGTSALNGPMPKAARPLSAHEQTGGFRRKRPASNVP